MTRRRWIADEVSGHRAAIVGAHAEHLSRVLRVRIGQRFDIATGVNVREGVITEVSDSRVEFQLGDEVLAAARPSVTLALSIFKFDRMEWAIEKCTELGAEKIIPVIAQRTEARLAAAAIKRVERWQRIAREASEQSRGLGPPDISQPTRLKPLLQLPSAIRAVLSESEDKVMLKSIFSTSSLSTSSSGEVVLAIGPEGGWTNSELDLFRAAGWLSVSLGSTILRAETAAIAALAVVLSQIQ